MNVSFLWSLTAPAVGEPAPMSDDQKWHLIRQYRGELLARCDWTQLPDVPLTLEEKQAWAAYRQDLRDITEDFSAPDEVVFPTPPGDGR